MQIPADIKKYLMRNQVGINPNMQNIDFYYKWLGSYPHYDSINKEGITLYEGVNYGKSYFVCEGDMTQCRVLGNNI